MYFLLGILVFIAFLLLAYLYVRLQVHRFFGQFGFNGNLADVIREAKLEDQEIPKSLASMDRIYLKQIKKDFPTIHIDELKRKAEKIIYDSYQAIEKKDSSSFKGKIKSFIDSKIQDWKDKNISFQQFKIHNTVISNYRRDGGMVTIYFSTAFEYYLETNGKFVKTQDRVKTAFIYVMDEEQIDQSISAVGIHCPNCGSPIKKLGEKSCSYCGSILFEVIGRVFTCNDIVQY